jgi:hypothetical protein
VPELRNDIFPKMTSFFQPREAIISSYIDEAFEALPSLFRTEQDIIEYINSLNTFESAELFLHICSYYLVSKKYQSASYVKLIMIISSIEKLVSKDKDFQEFHVWIQNQDEKIQIELEKMKL